MSYTYLYWGLNRLDVRAIEKALADAGQQVNFESKGTSISAISLKTSARKIMVSGAILMQSEYDMIADKVSAFGSEIEKKILIANNYEELEKLFESELGIALSKPIKEVEVVSTKVDVSKPIEAIEKPLVTEVEKHPEITGIPIGEVKVVTETISNEVDEFEIEDLRDENSDLKREKEFLLAEVSRLKSNSNEVEVEELKRVYNSKIAELEGSLRETNSKLEDEQQFISDLQSTVQALTSSKLELESALNSAKNNVKEELPPLNAPSNLTIAVASSTLSLTNVYSSLVSKNPGAILLDLSRESFLDMLVKLPSPIRITKWLLEGIQLRTMYSRFEPFDFLNVAEGLSIVSSPNVVLSDDLFEIVDWEECFSQIEETGRPTILFLGLENYNGVSEFINRLNTTVKVYRNDNPAELRAYNKIAYKHENVEEVLV